MLIRKYRDPDLDAVLSSWEKASRLAHPFVTDEHFEQERKNIPASHLPNAGVAGGKLHHPFKPLSCCRACPRGAGKLRCAGSHGKHSDVEWRVARIRAEMARHVSARANHFHYRRGCTSNSVLLKRYHYGSDSRHRWRYTFPSIVTREISTENMSSPDERKLPDFRHVASRAAPDCGCEASGSRRVVDSSYREDTPR